jgi:murein DD-endopeptidase MepM/ murein hydrolase activator NlpD
MTDGGSSMRKFRVTGRLLKILIGTAVALVLLLTGAIIVAVVFGQGLGTESSRVGVVARENRDLKDKLAEANAEIRQIQSKVSSFSTSLEKVSEYARRLRRFTHLSDPERNLAMGPIASREDDNEDGPAAVESAAEEEGIGPEARERRKIRVGIMDRKLAKLEKGAAATQTELDNLEKYFRDRQVILSSTPSIWPTRGVFASGFGMRRDPIAGVYSFHKGIDIFAETGTPVIAPADGTVIFASNHGGYGLHVLLDHGFGVKSRFGHLSVIEVKVGQKVKRGDKLGLVGSTGRSTGPHLHYEVLVRDVPQSPFRYILD